MTYIFINLFLQIDEAAMAALEEKETSAESSDASSWTIKETHFQPALAKIIPSITQRVYIDFVSLCITVLFSLAIRLFTLPFSIACLLQQLLYYEIFGESLKGPRSET